MPGLVLYPPCYRSALVGLVPYLDSGLVHILSGLGCGGLVAFAVPIGMVGLDKLHGFWWAGGEIQSASGGLLHDTGPTHQHQFVIDLEVLFVVICCWAGVWGQHHSFMSVCWAVRLTSNITTQTTETTKHSFTSTTLHKHHMYHHTAHTTSILLCLCHFVHHVSVILIPPWQNHALI